MVAGSARAIVNSGAMCQAAVQAHSLFPLIQWRKPGLHALTQHLALELAVRAIRVHPFRPRRVILHFRRVPTQGTGGRGSADFSAFHRSAVSDCPRCRGNRRHALSKSSWVTGAVWMSMERHGGRKHPFRETLTLLNGLTSWCSSKNNAIRLASSLHGLLAIRVTS